MTALTRARRPLLGERLHALADAARTEADKLRARDHGREVEVWVVARAVRTGEAALRTGSWTQSRGFWTSAAARVWQGDGCGWACAPVSESEAIGRLIEVAARRAASGGRAPYPRNVDGPFEGSWPTSLPPFRGAAVAELAAQGIRAAGTVQAALLRDEVSWTALARAGEPVRRSFTHRTGAYLRCETERGALLHGASLHPGRVWDPSAMGARMADEVLVLKGLAGTPASDLPLVLRPRVAAPLVSALGWVLRGDVAAATPGLVRGLGKKLFPACLSVSDHPRHPLSPARYEVDGEGRTVEPLDLIEAGRLVAFLHSTETAVPLGHTPNGRAFRSESAPPVPAPTNLFVVPGSGELPRDFTELVVRVENFNPTPRPGRVAVIAGGWEVRGGQRIRRVAPIDLELPTIEAFRALTAVGADLEFFLTSDGCGTPSLVLSPSVLRFAV